MSLITRTYSFTDGSVAYGSQVESEIANIVNTLNSLDQGNTTWTNVDVTTLSVHDDIEMGGNKVTGLGTPNTAGDAAIYPITNAQITAQTIRGSTANSGGSAQEISQGTISTPDLRTNAVTLSSAGTGSNSSDSVGTQIVTAAITTIGKPVLIVGHATLTGSSATSVGKARGSGSLILDIDGTKIATAFVQLAMDDTGNSFDFQWSMPIAFVHTPAAGAHTYKLSYAGGYSTASATNYQLSVVELRA